MKKAFTLIELLIVVAIIAILAAIAVPNFLEAQTRAKISRVQSDQRTYATALETYYIDNNSYPPHYPFTAAAGYVAPTGVTKNVNKAFWDASGKTGNTVSTNVPSFSAPVGNAAFGLTSPVSYLSTYVPDAFASEKQFTFAYVQGPAGFLLWSPGADGTDQLDGGTDSAAGHHNAEFIIRGGQSLPSPFLITGPGGTAPKPAGAQAGNGSFTYDATNGTGSEGDVYRTK